MRREFAESYHPGYLATVAIDMPDPQPVEDTTVTLILMVPTAIALAQFIQSGGSSWKSGLELNSILHNLRPALKSAGVEI